MNDTGTSLHISHWTPFHKVYISHTSIISEACSHSLALNFIHKSPVLDQCHPGLQDPHWRNDCPALEFSWCPEAPGPPYPAVYSWRSVIVLSIGKHWDKSWWKSKGAGCQGKNTRTPGTYGRAGSCRKVSSNVRSSGSVFRDTHRKETEGLRGGQPPKYQQCLSDPCRRHLAQPSSSLNME